MNSWKVILAAVVIFGAGVVTGGLLVNYVDHSYLPGRHRPPFFDSHRPPTNFPQERGTNFSQVSDRMNRQLMGQLDSALDLTTEQHDKIIKIIAEGQEQNHVIWTNVAPQMRAVMQNVNRQIREQLSPPQQKKFADMTKQFEDLMRQFGQHRPQFGTNAPSVSPPNR